MSLLIGVVDEPVSSTHKISWTDNKIGGLPVWMSSSKDQGIPQCKRCAKDMTLGLQLYCPLANSAYHRCLYLFVCSSYGCPQQNCWRVFRSVMYDKTYSTAKEDVTSKEFNDDMWTDGQDDWGDTDDWGQGSDEDRELGNEWDQNSSCIPVEVGTNTSDLKRVLSGEAICSDSSSVVRDMPESLMKGHKSGPFASPDDTTTDNDLSSSLSMMAMAGDGDGLDSLGDRDKDMATVIEEDLNMSHIHATFDHLSTVLNTKDKTTSVLDPCASRGSIVLSPFYLTVFDGSDQSQYASDDKYISHLIKDYERSEGKQLQDLITDRPTSSKGKGSSASSSESYEKADIKHGDKVFHKFLKVLQKFPEQCVRYDRCGQPLLVQCLTPDQSVIPPCVKCGSVRVFELQLVPALIPWLQSHQGDSSGIEFGTVLVYSCSQSCPPSNGDPDLVEEHVITQFDPDHHLFR